MLDLDQRVTEGLRELASRAPVNAEVWPAAERYVAKHRKRRHAIAGALVVLALVAGGVATAVAVRPGDSKVEIANPGPSSGTSPGGPAAGPLGPSGPVDGSFTITAGANGLLAFNPSAVTVTTGVYAVTLVDAGPTSHTLAFDDPSTLWSLLMVNSQGATQTTRVFFGRPGVYTFYCVIPGHRAAGMQGTVTVTGPPITLAEAEADGTPQSPATTG